METSQPRPIEVLIGWTMDDAMTHRPHSKVQSTPPHHHPTLAQRSLRLATTGAQENGGTVAAPLPAPVAALSLPQRNLAMSQETAPSGLAVSLGAGQVVH